MAVFSFFKKFWNQDSLILCLFTATCLFVLFFDFFSYSCITGVNTSLLFILISSLYTTSALILQLLFVFFCFLALLISNCNFLCSTGVKNNSTILLFKYLYSCILAYKLTSFNYLFNTLKLHIHFSFIFKSWVVIKLLAQKYHSKSWSPIFKRYSIFGYYRMGQQHNISYKVEEVNYLKY